MTKLKLLVGVLIGLFVFFGSAETRDVTADVSSAGADVGSERSAARSAPLEHPDEFNRQLRPLITGIDYHTRMLYIIDYNDDELVIVNPLSIRGWPGDLPLQHTVISPDGRTLYVTTDNTPENPAYLIVLRIKKINWKNRTANLRVVRVAPFDEPNTAAELPFVEQVDQNQPIADWLLAGGTQIHGPTRLPYTDCIYFTTWTSDKVRVWNAKKRKFAKVDPIQIEGYTEQTHGIVFNKSGTLGLGSGYFFDNNVIDLYKVNRQTCGLTAEKQIKLGTDQAYAAFSHYVYWLDEQHAITATMQFDRTSLTPADAEVLPPGVWLLDSWEGTATEIIPAANGPDEAGIFRSASDIAVLGDTLFVAEEDTLDDSLFEDGYISAFDISDRYNPVFIKRFKPGVDLPDGFTVAHSLTPTPDNRYLFVASWHSGYLIKIDALSNEVVGFFGPSDDLVMPHGLYGAGNIR